MCGTAGEQNAAIIGSSVEVSIAVIIKSACKLIKVINYRQDGFEVM